MTKIGITALRAHLSQTVNRVKRGEHVEVVQHGKVIALLTPPSRQPTKTEAVGSAKDVEAFVRALINRKGPPPSVGLSGEDAEQLVRAVRAERGAE